MIEIVKQREVDLFICKVNLYAPGGCWLWTAGVRRWKREPWDGGYGAFWFRGKVVRAHLFAHWWLFGPVPDGKVLLHSCDNRRCVNVVDHVRPGTQEQNIRDMVKKGRARNAHMRLVQKASRPDSDVRPAARPLLEVRGLQEEGARGLARKDSIEA